MGLWAWLFSHHSDSVTDYEQLFRTNEERIRLTARAIRDAKYRVRRLHRQLLGFTGAAGAVLVALEYVRKPRRWTNDYIVEVAVVFSIFPLVLFTTKRSIGWFFTRKIQRLEESLQELKAAQDDKIAEFKKFTNFGKLRELVSKYDEAPDIDLQTEEPEVSRSTPANEWHGAGTQFLPQPGHEDISALLKKQRSLVDRVCDYLLADGPSNRYALICKFCFTHNGLVVREDLDSIQYICCCCGQLNRRFDQQELQPITTDDIPSLERHTSDPNPRSEAKADHASVMSASASVSPASGTAS